MSSGWSGGAEAKAAMKTPPTAAATKPTRNSSMRPFDRMAVKAGLRSGLRKRRAKAPGQGVRAKAASGDLFPTRFPLTPAANLRYKAMRLEPKETL